MTFPWRPTLREFLLRTREYGLDLRVTHVAFDSPRGVIRFIYVEGENVRIPLPDIDEDEGLTKTVVASLCVDLGIPPEDFGLHPDDALEP